MASLLTYWTGSSAKYEPLPRYLHLSVNVGSKVIVQGGRTKVFSEQSKQHLASGAYGVIHWKASKLPRAWILRFLDS